MKTWSEFFKDIETKDYFNHLMSFLDSEYSSKTIYPERKNLFKAFELTPVENIKVVIIGQDPYHEPGQAQGLSFSVPEGTKVPPSLVNIFKEIHNDIGCEMNFKNGDLTYLAKQGVLLINAYLTVIAGQALSHHIKEYDLLMLDIVDFLNKLNQPIVFMLWGNFAKKYAKYMTNPKHLVLQSAHPSPLGANHGGWFNEHQFSKVNYFLEENNSKKIEWSNIRN